MNPMILLLIYGLVVILPIFFWFWFFRYQDREEPEPLKLLFKMFLLGFIAVIVALVVENYLDGYLLGDQGEDIWERLQEGGDWMLILAVLSSYFLAGPIEELVKYLMVRGSVSNSPHFNQIADGAVYASVVALGFSLVENTGYFVEVYSTLEIGGFLFVVIFRGIATTMLHVLTAGLMGLALGKFLLHPEGKRSTVVWTIVLASLIHGIYNVLIFIPLGIILNLVILLMVFGFLVIRMRSREAQYIWPPSSPRKK